MTTARCPTTVAGVFTNRAEAERAVAALHEAGFRKVHASAASAAGVTGMTDALVGLGVPQAEAPWYDNEFRSGRTIVTVASEGRADEAWSILHRFGAYNRTFPAAAGTATAATAETAGRTMQLHEEELRAQKQPVKAGEVQVRKEVKTEHRTIDVPVRKEEVVVERHDVPDRPAPGADFRPGQEIRIPVMEERVRVEKTPVVTEEVRVGKRATTETEHAAGDVRKEEVKVERKGDVDVRSKNVRTDKR